jgi:hypothetical protein
MTMRRLSACMLGRLRMPLKKAIEEYAKLMREAFADKKIWTGSSNAAYKGTKLQEALRSMIRDTAGNESEPMVETQAKGDWCKT